MAELALVYGVAKGAVNIGMGLYRLYKNKDAGLDSCSDAVEECLSELDIGGSRGVNRLRKDMKAVRQDIQRVLDNQASLVALLAQGADAVCARLDALQQQVDKGFNAVLKTVKDEAALRDAREFKTKLSTLTAAYDRITDDIIEAAQSRNKALPKCTGDDAKKAEASATDLYHWANALVPDSAESAQGATRQEKLQMMPYIVAMAYAARVLVVTQLLERDLAGAEREKTIFLNRARRTVDDFLDVLSIALDGLMADTSLLEIALVYQLPMATYLTLMTSFRSSVDDLLSRGGKGKDAAVWDDGLAPIRAALHWKPDHGAQDEIIELKGVNNSIWWLTFTDTNLESADISTMRKSIHVRELYHVLGAADDNQAAHIALNPVAVCPDGERVVSGSSDRTVRVWSLSTGQLLRTLSGHTNDVNCVAVSPDGKRAVSGSDDKSVRVWSVDSGSAQHTLQGHTHYVRAVAVSPDGRSIASGSGDGTVRLWDVYTGQCHATLTGHSTYVCCVAFSPDGQTLVSGSWDKSIKVWNVRTRKLQRTLNGHSHYVRGVAVTPDGQWLVSGSTDKTVRVWSLSSGAEEMAFTEHTADVNCVAVFPDGQRIASGSSDNTVRVWNLRSRKLERTLTGRSGSVYCVAVSPDGRSVVSGSGDCTIKVWALSG